MKQPELFWSPFITLFEREIRRFMKVTIQTIFTPMVTATLYLLIFGVSLGSHIQLSSGVSYLAFLIPGLVMMSCLNNAFQNSSSSIVSAKFSGDLEDLKVAPLSLEQIIWAVAFGGLIRGAVVGLVTLFVGEVFFWATDRQLLAVAHPLHLAFFISMGGLSFALLGLAVAFWSKNFDHLAAVNSFILLPLIYLGGVFFSLESLHPFWQGVAKFNPLLYLINGVRYGFLGASDVAISTAAIVSMVSLLALYILARVTLARSSFARW